MALTQVAETVEALVALIREATGVQVLDGATLGEVMFETIVVGVSDDAQSAPYTSTLSEQPGLGRPRYRENWDVRCLLTITDGDGSVAAVRSRAVQVLTELDEVLRQHNVGIWERARVGADFRWYPLQHDDGATVDVFFSITGSNLL